MVKSNIGKTKSFDTADFLGRTLYTVTVSCWKKETDSRLMEQENGEKKRLGCESNFFVFSFVLHVDSVSFLW